MLRSLRAKLALTYAGLTLLTVGALSLYTVNSLEELLLRRLADDLSTQARLIADEVSEDLANGRLEAVEERVARIDALTNARTIVVDAERRTVGVSEESDLAGLGRPRDDTGLQEALEGIPSSGTLPRTPDGEILYATAPIWHAGQVVGAARLAYRLEDVEGPLRKLNAIVVVGAVGAVVAAVAISLGFARAIGNPIRELSRAAHALAAGDLQQRLRRVSDDEVGELVESFNTMAARLRESEKARREFASDVSHELHSLASSMQTAVEALERGAARDDALRARLVGGLVGHAHRLSRLSEDLLQLARLEEGQLSLQPRACSLAEIVTRTVDQFAADAQQKGVALEAEVGEPMPLCADDVRLVQAIGNLVENAIKYTAAGGRVLVRAVRDGEDYVVCVTDNGQGIPPEELPLIWERYYRVEGRASGGAAGTGLGLAIAARIVRAHGGSIAVDSALEQGTTFTIRLPRDPRATPALSPL